MEPSTKNYRQELGYGQVLSKTADVRDYVRSLQDPWSGAAKIPLGFPVKSSCTSFTYKLPVSVVGTTFTIGSSVYTLTTAGTAVGFWFNPNQFDSANLFQATYTGSGITMFSNWSAVATSKGYATQMASYRLVSAGIKFIYTGASLYAKGQLFSGACNARSNTDYGGYSNFIADPDTTINPLNSYCCVAYAFTPIDLDSMSFISTNVTDANFSDWSVFMSLDSYDSTNGCSGYFDICVNYEVIPYGSYGQLLGPTLNPGGTQEDVRRAVREAKEVPKKPSDFENISKDALDWVRRYGKVMPFP